MSAPLYKRIKSYTKENRISFAMPGHKNGRGIKRDLLSLDVTELSMTENLHHPDRYVKNAQEMLSELYGSEHSYILTGGSTAAVQSMICGAVKTGGTLLAGSDCHMSVINTCSLLGINIRFFPKEINKIFAVTKRTETIDKYLTDDIDAVIIASPNYYGICSDIKSIAEECHKKSIPLLVDEAHGAHFVSDKCFPETAVRYADAVCHSAHKTLNALNGAAYLHINGGLIDRARCVSALSMFQSSSPSYPVAASADTAREEISGKNNWRKTYELCRRFKEKAESIGIRTLQNDDMTRLVLNFSDFDTTGFEISEKLCNEKIDAETADLFNVALIVTPSNTKNDLNKLFASLKKIMKDLKPCKQNITIAPPPVTVETLFPQRAFFADSTETELKNAAGRVSCVCVTPYPPGVPVIHTGEIIRTEQIEYIETLIKSGAEITGLSDGRVTVIK